MKPLAARGRKAVIRVSCLVSSENHWWRSRSLQKKCLTALSRLPAAGRHFASPRGETCRLVFLRRRSDYASSKHAGRLQCRLIRGDVSGQLTGIDWRNSFATAICFFANAGRLVL